MGLFARWNGSLPTVVFTDNKNNPNVAATTNKSFSVSIGAASPTRYVLCAVYHNGGVSNFKINGVAATQHVVAGDNNTYLFGLAVASGTTATVTWTGGGASSQEKLAVWAAYDLASTTPHGTSSFFNDNAAPSPFNCNTPDNGILVAFSDTLALAAATPTATWTGVTEDFDVRPWRDGYSGGSIQTTTAETPRTLSVTWTATVGASGVAASFS